MQAHRCWPGWVAHAVLLACGVNIAAALAIALWAMQHVADARLPETLGPRVPAGFWFCLGQFGNGCRW